MHQRLPTRSGPISIGCASGEPCSAVRIASSTGSSSPNSASRARNAPTDLSCAILGYSAIATMTMWWNGLAASQDTRGLAERAVCANGTTFALIRTSLYNCHIVQFCDRRCCGSQQRCAILERRQDDALSQLGCVFQKRTRCSRGCEEARV